MEGLLKVTPEKLISASQEFSSCSSVVRGLTSQMTNLINGLNGAIWSGEAATAYIAKFKQLDDDIERMNKMIQEHVRDLQTMANTYKQAEAEAKQASSALPTNPIN